MSPVAIFYNTLTAIVVSFCAVLQIAYYITPKSRLYFLLDVIAAFVLTFSYPFINGLTMQIIYTIVAIVLCCILCAVTFYGGRYHKLYSTLIQAIISIASIYISKSIVQYLFATSKSAALLTFGFIAFFNAIWCVVMFFGRRLVFTIMPEPEENYFRTFIACTVILPLLLFCVFGGDKLIMDRVPYGLTFIGLIGIVTVVSIVDVLRQCAFSNLSMIHEDRLILVASQNQIMKQYVDEFANYSSSIRVIEHDQRYLIDTLAALLEVGETSQAAKILDELSERNARLRRKAFCNDNVVNAILVNADNRCTEIGCTFEAKVRFPEPVAIQHVDLVSLLKNMLDNAIDCCAGLSDPSRGRIDLNIYTAGGYLAIKCRNTVDRAPRIKNDRIVTTKLNDGRRHGIGLESMHIVAKKYEGTLHLSSDGQTFYAEAVIENTSAPLGALHAAPPPSGQKQGGKEDRSGEALSVSEEEPVRIQPLGWAVKQPRRDRRAVPDVVTVNTNRQDEAAPPTVLS